ncbi:hypothetical protein SPRG_01898 [Saprolegnia parasitica CBS 223.65]|uniref:Uncharacterized protein n=1 Tax=Saprolegnia parasitica (strain CBS 223.65) TaxID=695850 RepID=A0A067CQV6_SAPPC|nr:hypothetical protein SPRG_01898 [Saprolegnia parasitica CBS 223.65]KDO33084.1 hypothetical protein SPRG_01898 [Saprolegnia parasitica CBS 223.65]|eukprot:XP_012195854.1 hypothetical protein SPRG_01898 [Saprolegnia parasitica CBS 223.65]
MGAGASIQGLSAADVAAEVKRLGEAYHEYAPLFTRNGIDGAILQRLSDTDLDNLLVDLGVSSALHRKILLLHLSKIKTVPTTSPSSLDTNDGRILVHRSTPSLAPAQVLSQLFAYQGIHLIDPDDLVSVVTKIVPLVKPVSAHDEYDCFISYRVASEKEVAEKLYLHLKTKGYEPFLDRMSLKNAEPWKDGFLRGLGHSHLFLALVSEAGLEKARDRTQNHHEDNLLLEYEVALEIATAGRLNVLPIYVAASNNGNFVKFQGFNPDLYAPTLDPEDATSRRTSVPVAALPGLSDAIKRRQSEMPASRPLQPIPGEDAGGVDASVNRKVSLSETMTTNLEDLVATLYTDVYDDVFEALEKIFGIVQRSKYAIKFAQANGWVALIHVLCHATMDGLQKDYAAGALSFIAPALVLQPDGGSDEVWAAIEGSLEAHHAELIEKVLGHGSAMQKQYIVVTLMHLCERDHLRDVLRMSEELQLVLEELKPKGSQVQAHACSIVLMRCFPPTETSSSGEAVAADAIIEEAPVETEPIPTV